MHCITINGTHPEWIHISSVHLHSSKRQLPYHFQPAIYKLPLMSASPSASSKSPSFSSLCIHCTTYLTLLPSRRKTFPDLLVPLRCFQGCLSSHGVRKALRHVHPDHLKQHVATKGGPIPRRACTCSLSHQPIRQPKVPQYRPAQAVRAVCRILSRQQSNLVPAGPLQYILPKCPAGPVRQVYSKQHYQQTDLS